MEFFSVENQDAIRLSWNVLPPNKLSLVRAHMPLGCVYTPMKDLEDLQTLQYRALQCSKCQAFINPHCKIDFNAKVWGCPFCYQRNAFPKEYADNISQTQLPAEIMQEYSTIEYLVQNKNLQSLPPPIYLFVIDTCIPKEELQAIKHSIFQSISLMPPETLVGLITFGRFTFVHELGFQDCSKSFAFKGDKEYTTQQIFEMLGMPTKNDPRGPHAAGLLKKFILPISECEQNLTNILEDLSIDPWIVPNDERAYRCTGHALSVAISISEAAAAGQGSKILTFMGGPCTFGPGKVVGIKLEEMIRNWVDIQKNNEFAKHVKNSLKFYNTLTQRAIKAGATVDIFAFTLDQFGLHEMKSLAEKTGGIAVTNELFDSQNFKDTFSKIFDKDEQGQLRFGFCGEIGIHLSKELRVSGAIGPCTSLKKQSPMISDTEIGQGGTVQWYLGGMDKNSSIAFYLDLHSQDEKPANQNSQGFIQFVTKYRHANGQYVQRVTTIKRRFGNPNNFFDLVQGFDQEAAVVLLSRQAVFKTESEDPLDVIRWLDRSLIRMSTRFGEFKKDDVNSFRLPDQFELVPQLIYNLRRSNFVQQFATSPDESAFYRGLFNRESTSNSAVMIQPSLLTYSFDSEQPQSVLLDIASMKNNVILLLDTYFDIVIWKGDTIRKWEAANYQDQPEYENFKNLLAAPIEDAKFMINDRYPAPTLFQTYPGHTKERKLKSKVNPSGLELDNATCQEGDFINDDASLQMFMSHLIKIVVTTNQ